MKIDEKIYLELKRDYLKLSLEISKLRDKRGEVFQDFIQLAQGIGRLAGISNEELNDLFIKPNTKQPSTAGLFLLQTLPNFIE